MGSPVIQYLAAAGVGHLTIIDDDTVDVSNLQRQTIHKTTPVGSTKTGAPKSYVQAFPPTLTEPTKNIKKYLIVLSNTTLVNQMRQS